MTPEELVILSLDYLDIDPVKVDRLGYALDFGDEGAPPGVRAYFGTDTVEGEPAFTFSQRKGRCYEMTALALVTNDFPDGTRLVHGTIHGPEDDMVRMGHSWLLLGSELVWEPARAMIHPRDDWYAFARATEEQVYDLYEARKQMVLTGHYGRWHKSEYR